MPNIPLAPFLIEHYYTKYEFVAEYMLSSSDAQSCTVEELLALEPDAHQQLNQLWLGYTESTGAPYLREVIASIYQTMTADQVLVFASAEEGIFVLYNALVDSQDHVIVESPCYQSAFEVARSTGAKVSAWQRHSEDGWAHDLAALERLIQPNTKIIAINTPNNPTGSNMDEATLRAVVELARSRNIILFCDEVYRELEHDPTTRLPAACDLYENAISLGSISKSYGLPGLRLGWYACRNQQLLKKALDVKLYTTICSSAPSEFLVALALRQRQVLLARNLAIIAHNLPLLEAFLARYSQLFSWTRPTASPIGFVKVEQSDIDDFCQNIVQKTSVLLLPGSVYGEPQHLRFGYGRSNMPVALAKLEGYLQGLGL
jgi:aspartate/methionine/tyrosine aminotransferase